MPELSDAWKRLLVGRAQQSTALGETLLPKRIALPIFASDPLSSVAYATQEILLFLTLGGLADLYLTPYLAGAVFLSFCAVVVASYRQLVHAYPTGGGDYEVAHRNLGERAGLTVASALLVDYVLTVAVSVSAGVDNIISRLPPAQRVPRHHGGLLRSVPDGHEPPRCPRVRKVLRGADLRLRTHGSEHGCLGAGPLGDFSARYRSPKARVMTSSPEITGLGGLALVFFVLRAFSSGCTALTGVEAIANGVPAFKKPKSKNAATTLLLMGSLSMSMFLGITCLALISDVHYTENTCDLVGFARRLRDRPAAQCDRTGRRQSVLVSALAKSLVSSLLQAADVPPS